MEFPDSEPMEILCNETQNQMEVGDSSLHSSNQSLPTSSRASADIHSTARSRSSKFKDSSQPFQNLFTRDEDSLCESGSSVFRKQNPWDDDTSYKSDNFIPFLSKPKKLKLVNHKFSKELINQEKPKELVTPLIPKEMVIPPVSKEMVSPKVSTILEGLEISKGLEGHAISKGSTNTIDSSSRHRRKQSKPKMYEKLETDKNYIAESLSKLSTAASPHPQGTSVREETLTMPDIETFKKTFVPHIKPSQALSILERARMKLDKREVSTASEGLETESVKPSKYSKTHLYPEYSQEKERDKSDQSWWNTKSAKKEFPKPDPTKKKSYNLTRIRMLSEQFFKLIEDEKENKKKVQEIQTFCKSKWPSSENLRSDLESAVGSSNGVLEECVRALRGLGRVEEHCAVLSQILNEMDYLKKEVK